MRLLHLRLHAPLALGLLAISACVNDPGAPSTAPVATLTIDAPDSIVTIGQDLSLGATARDANGTTVPGHLILWTSRDPTTATVTSSGVVRGVAAGILRVVAQVEGGGAIADSILLRVSSGAIAPGRLRVRVRGAVSHQAEWEGYGEYNDVLAADTGEVSYLSGRNINDSGADSSLTVIVPARLGTGSLAIGRYTPGVRASTPAAFLILDGPAPGVGDAWFLASLPGGTLSVSTAEYPPAPGLEVGLIHGVLAFRAVRLVAGPGGGGGPIPTTDTVDVHAEFAAHWYHYLRPNVTLTLSGGGPLLGMALGATAQASDDGHGGMLVSWDADFDGIPGQSWRWEVTHDLRLGGPPVAGTFALAALTPPEWADPDRWPAVYSALYYRDDPRLALSTGGTVTITRYVPPQNAYYGELHGTLTAPLALWTDAATVSADTVVATVRFAVQLWPLGGVPAAPKPQRQN